MYERVAETQSGRLSDKLSFLLLRAWDIQNIQDIQDIRTIIIGHYDNCGEVTKDLVGR